MSTTWLGSDKYHFDKSLVLIIKLLGCVQGMSLNRRGEMWVASLLWTQFCLKNGSLHRKLPFAIKRTTLIDWKGFSKWQSPYGDCHLESKEQFWLVGLAAILEEPFASVFSTLKLKMPWRHLWDRPSTQIGKKPMAEVPWSRLGDVPWMHPWSTAYGTRALPNGPLCLVGNGIEKQSFTGACLLGYSNTEVLSYWGTEVLKCNNILTLRYWHTELFV